MATNPEKKPTGRQAAKKPAAKSSTVKQPAAKDRTKGAEHSPILSSFKSRGRDYWTISVHRDLVAEAGWPKGQRFTAQLGPDGRLVLLPTKAAS